MKRVVKVQEIEADGLVSLLGKKIYVQGCRYSYSGILSGVNDDCICIENPGIVYETGQWELDNWKDVQSLGVSECFVQKAAIEMVMEGK